ncbi:MAG: hypothetical protein LBL00_00385, partial [Endomicrobium sp.]|nr:hypothetical protein [Endomicrobium sp.]
IGKMLGGIERLSGIYSDLYFGVEANAKAVFESAVSSKIKVIVAGGFHTAGINDILNKKRINNITFMPRITSAGQENSQKYVEYARTLYSAGNAAIPLPDFNGITLEELASRVLKTVFNERINNGLDLSSQAVKEDIESFMSARKDIAEVDFSYSKRSITYKDKTSGIVHSVPLKESDYPAYSAKSNLTMLGEVVPNMIMVMLREATFKANDIIPNLFLRMVRKTDYYRDIYGDDELSLKSDISYGTFNYESFFTSVPLFLNKFIIETLSSLINVNKEYPKIYEEIKKKASVLLSGFDEDKIEIRIVDASFLINEEGWCYAALNGNRAAKSAVLYVHADFIEAIKNKTSSERENIIQELIMHESMENNALYNEESEEYFYFGEYLRLNNIGEEGRTIAKFHDFISSPQFSLMLSKTSMKDMTQKGQQKELLKLGKKIMSEAVSRHEEIQHIHKIESLDRVSKPIKNDLIMLRLGDTAVIEKYADEISKYIKDKNLDDSNSFAIAVRHTQPIHVMQKIAKLVGEKTGLEIIYVTQDEYMDYAPMRGQIARENIRDNYEIAEESVDNVVDKRIIILEDVTKTGFVFGKMSKPLNEAGALSVIPLAIFDIIGSLAPAKVKGVQVHSSINELFNINDYLTTYMKANPKEIAEKIIALKGDTTKYFYYAMSELLKSDDLKSDDHKAFNIIIDRLKQKDADAAEAKNTLLENMYAMVDAYPEIASEITPLLFFIKNDLTPKELSEGGNALTGYLSHYIGDKFEKSTGGVLEITSDDLDKWGKFQWLIPLYCRLHGFTKMHINLQKPADISPKNNLSLRETAQQLKIGVLYQYQSEKEIADDEKLQRKSKIKQAVKDRKLDEAVNAARQDFKDAIIANEKNKDLYADKTAANKYKNAIKKIMAEVNEIVKEIITEEKAFTFNPDLYSIVVGGSLVNGSVTANSDIYYDIIARDSSIVEPIQKLFLPAYQYALECTG